MMKILRKNQKCPKCNNGKLLRKKSVAGYYFTCSNQDCEFNHPADEKIDLSQFPKQRSNREEFLKNKPQWFREIMNMTIQQWGEFKKQEEEKDRNELKEELMNRRKEKLDHLNP